MKIQNLSLVLSTALLLSACGGGGSGGSEQPISTGVNQSTPSTFDSEPYYQYAWHLSKRKNGFASNNNINEDSHINITKAWELTTGIYTVGPNINQAVRVAVIDDNFQANHEDIKDSVIAQYNFDDDNDNVSPAEGESSHGTAVANFISASQNNKGLIGSAPSTEIILIKQLDGSIAKTIQAFEYAKDQGAKVINCSWGSPLGVSEIVAAKIQDLKDNHGITIVFASGNNNEDLDGGIIDESELDSVIGVGASDKNNKKAEFSNYGTKMDLIAPGGGDEVGVLSAFVPTGQEEAITYGENIDTEKYSFTQGTSFSAPITAGVIALMISVNPSLTPDEIRTILIETADKIESETEIYEDLEGDGTTSTFNTQRAYGKINAYEAVNRAKNLYVP